VFVPALRQQYYVDRLTKHVGPVVPTTLLGISGLQILSAAGYWFGLSPTPSKAAAAALISAAVVVAMLAWLVQYASRRELVELASVV
jgi:hypothetical protein